MRPDVWAGRHGRCRRTRADTPPPCHSGPTGGKDVDYTHFSSSLLPFLPPLSTHPSLSISIMMAAFRQLALLYPLPLLPSAPPYSFTPHSLPLSAFSSHKFTYRPFSRQPLPYFITRDSLRRESASRPFVGGKKSRRAEEEGVLVFEPGILPFHGV